RPDIGPQTDNGCEQRAARGGNARFASGCHAGMVVAHSAFHIGEFPSPITFLWRAGGLWPALTTPQVRCTCMAMSKIEKPGKIRKICVYCGSSPGTDPAFEAAARAFGAILANKGIHLVFGGGAVGIMGAISKSVLDHGGTM